MSPRVGSARPGRWLWGACSALVVLVATTPVAVADRVPPVNWQVEALGVEAAWEVTQGDGVLIGQVDSIVDEGLPDLAGKVAAARWFTEVGEASHHGTGIAGVLVGAGVDRAQGVAPAAGLVAAQYYPQSTGDWSLDEMIRWLVDEGVGVLNLSLGAPPEFGQQLRDGIAYAQEHDVVVVASAGNSWDDPDVDLPGAYPGVIAVTATTADGGFCDCSASGPLVGLAAPGHEVPVLDPSVDSGLTLATGTSVSAALVAGTAALVRSAHPELDAANVVNRLVATATDEGPSGRDDRFGFGIVNPLAAVTADVPLVAANPLFVGREDEATGRPSGSPSPVGEPTGAQTLPPPPTGTAPGGSGSDGLPGVLIAGMAAVMAVLLVAGTLVARNRRSSQGPAT